MFTFLLSPLLQFAAVCNLKPAGSFLKFPTWYKYLHGEVVAGKCTPVLFTSGHPELIGQSIGRILLAVIEIMLRIAALAAVGFIIYGGYRFILSQGEPDQQTAARDTVINAVIGLVITIMATVIVSFVFSNLAK